MDDYFYLKRLHAYVLVVSYGLMVDSYSFDFDCLLCGLDGMAGGVNF